MVGQVAENLISGFLNFFFISSLHKNLTFKGSGSYDCLSWIKICKFHATDLEIGTY